MLDFIVMLWFLHILMCLTQHWFVLFFSRYREKMEVLFLVM